MAPKRKHVTLTLKLKHEILEQLQRGVSGKQLAKKYGIGTSTVSDIKKQKAKLESFIAKCDSDPGSRKTFKKAEYPKMEGELYSWILRQRKIHAPISYEILAQKAKQLFAKCYGNSNFNASRGWISNFKKRHGVLKISGGKLTNDSSLVGPFKKKLCEKIRSLNLLPSQIYNADSSTLFWKLLPDKALILSKEERETSKETLRLTFMVSSNANGSHKLHPFVIGKVRNPKVFENVQLPVEYKSTPNSSMTSSVFTEWFHTSFISQVRNFSKTHNLSQNALLLVDNASSHAPDKDLVSEDGKIVTMFLPSNCTGLIQPMYQSAIRLIKLFYRKSLVSHILSSEEKGISKCLKSVNLKNSVSFLFEAWENVSADVLTSCWNNLLDEKYEDDNTIPSPLLHETFSAQREDLQTISEMIKQVTGNDSITENEVKEWIEVDEVWLPEEDEKEEEEIKLKVEVEESEEIHEHTTNLGIKSEEATHCFNVCLQWAEENNVSSNDILILRKLKEKAFLLNNNEMK